MRLLFKILLPILVILLGVAAARVVIANKPEPRTRPQFKTSTAIEATRVTPQDYTVTLKTQGEVSSATEGPLVAEVAGSITEVAENFVVGGAFRKGDVLVRVDPRDYEIALTLAEANFAQAEATLAEEAARAEQAASDWRKLGRKGKPSDLTLRKPQLAAARANLEGARGQVQRAQLDLERTNIRARFDGRVRARQVSLGQYVNRGSALGEIFSTDTAEIRLPFTSSQIRFIDLDSAIANQQNVKLQASAGATNTQWSATLARTEGIDASSRQFYVVASIDSPYALEKPLRVGQYVEASVTGTTLKDVFVIPRSSLREDKSVLLVDDIGTLQSKEVVVEWKDADVAVISDGLSAGDVLNITALGSVTNGTRVKATIDGVAPQDERRGKPSNAGNNDNRPGNEESKGKPEFANKATTAGAANNSVANNSGGNAAASQDQRMQRLKAMVDAGEPLPARAVERIKARIAAGESVPDWLKNHIEATAK